MGAPGAGKGTQATAVAERLGIPAVSTGDIFRQHVRDETALGRQVKEITASGAFVPDALTNGIVQERLAQPDAAGGFLLDGYPRTVAQVRFLDELLASQGQRLDAVVELVVDDDILVSRLLGRAREQGRADDTEEVIRERMALYHEQTEPLTQLYAAQGVLRRVDGTGDVEQVRERIAAALAAVPD